MALALALVAGLCGGAWAQDWGHNGGDQDRDARYRNDPNYQYRNGQWVYVPQRSWPNGPYYPNGTWGYGPGTWAHGRGGYNYAYQMGYNDGINDGRIDARFHRGFRPGKGSNYKHADHGYDKSWGDKGAYRQAYRNGYMAGYRIGFGRGW
jgi:hypothetical protein